MTGFFLFAAGGLARFLEFPGTAVACNQALHFAALKAYLEVVLNTGHLVPFIGAYKASVTGASH